jgi:hypothetical protein
MKRLVALCAALVLTLVFAAPAAANSKVVVDEWDDEDFYEWMIDSTNPFITDCGPFDPTIGPFGGWVCEGWVCGDDTIYAGNKAKGSLTLWYPKSVDPAEYMPEGEAWPWKKGQIRDSGVDYFSTGEAKTGKVVSGKYGVTIKMRDHHLGGDPDYLTDPETWMEQLTGKTWGITAPGVGNLFFEAGNHRYKITLQYPGLDFLAESEELRPWKGNSNLDGEGLCAYFGYGYEEVEGVEIRLE